MSSLSVLGSEGLLQAGTFSMDSRDFAMFFWRASMMLIAMARSASTSKSTFRRMYSCLLLATNQDSGDWGNTDGGVVSFVWLIIKMGYIWLQNTHLFWSQYNPHNFCPSQSIPSSVTASGGDINFIIMAQDESPAAIKYLNPNELSSLEQMLDNSDVNLYFKSLPTRNIGNQMISSYYSEKILQGLQGMVEEGELQVAKQSKKVEDLLEGSVIDEEVQKAMEMKAKKEFIQKQLEYLKLQTNPNRNKTATLEEGNNLILSKEQHKSLVKKIKREREQREKKHHELLTLMQQKSKEKEEEQARMREEKEKIELQLRREMIEKNLKKHKEEHENLAKIERESRDKIKSLKNHKFMYQQIEEKYQNQVVLQNLEEKKKKLKEIRQYKSFSIDELKEHEKTYLEKKKLNESRQVNLKDEWTYQPPPKSQRLAVILQEEKLQKIKKLEEKKKQLDYKLNRQQEYIVYLKQNFTVKVDPQKRQQLQKRLQKQKIVKPQPLDLHEIGRNYLQEAKRKRKKQEKTDPRPQTQRNATNPVNVTNMTINSNESKPRAFTNYLTIDRNGQHFQKRRRKNLEKLMKSDEISEVQKIKQLKLQSDKINTNMQQKQKQLKYKRDHKVKEDALELLLSSIQAKIGIIEMYN